MTDLHALLTRAGEALTEINGCYDAAVVEGLIWQLANCELTPNTTEPGSLVDLVQRRLLPAFEIARALHAEITTALADAPPQLAPSSAGAELSSD